MSIAEKLITIAENEQKVYNAGQIATLKDSRYMNGKESGTIISVNDVTPIEHNVGVKVASKNLVDFNSIVQFGYATECVTDGASFTARGNEGSRNYAYDAGQIEFPKYTGNNLVTNGIPLKKGITYTISFDYLLIERGKYDSGIKLILYNSTLTQTLFSVDFSGVVGTTKRCSHSFTIPEDDNTGFCFRINNNYVTISNIQLELGTTATSYTPYVEDLTGVEVARYGKNLWDEQWVNGVYGTTTGNFTSRNDFIASHPDFPILVKPNTNYYFVSPQQLYVMFYGENDNFLSYKGVKNNSLTTPADCKYIRFYVHTNYGSTYLNDICICYGTTTTEYEPYIEPITYTANADGTVEGVKSISPNMTLIPNSNAVTVECEYLRDIDLYIDNLITNVALTGGE